MLFLLVRIIFWGLLFLISIYLLKKSNIINKKKAVIILFIIFLILSFISCLYLVENLFITFKSPRQAYNYIQHKEKDLLVLNGKRSSLVIGGYNSSKSSLELILKKNDGWKLSKFDLKQVKHTYLDGVFILVYKYKNYDDYYILINSTNKDISSISDNINSKFYTFKRNYNGITSCRGYAYIKEFNDEYKIIIDNKSIEINKR